MPVLPSIVQTLRWAIGRRPEPSSTDASPLGSCKIVQIMMWVILIFKNQVWYCWHLVHLGWIVPLLNFSWWCGWGWYLFGSVFFCLIIFSLWTIKIYLSAWLGSSEGGFPLFASLCFPARLCASGWPLDVAKGQPASFIAIQPACGS